MPKIRELTRILAVSIALFGATFAEASEAVVRVLAEDGQPVPDVAVFILQDGVQPAAPPADPAVMDQVDTRFVPHMLVVQKGTAVNFPNSDVIAHHVYSFSKPNNFILPLYKGDAHDPVIFEHDGVVTLGCNIHDRMLGYIVIVDTDVFGKTDATGQISLPIDLGASGLTVRIWNPRIRDDEAALSQVFSSPISDGSVVSFQLQKKLRTPHHSETDGLQWSEY